MLVTTSSPYFCFTTVILKVDHLDPMRLLNGAVILAFVKNIDCLLFGGF